MHNKLITSEKYVSDTLDIPSNLKIESIIAVGYPDETKPFHEKKELQYAWQAHFAKDQFLPIHPSKLLRSGQV